MELKVNQPQRNCEMTVESWNSGRNYAVVARQRRVNHVAAAPNKRATTKELLEAIFFYLVHAKAI